MLSARGQTRRLRMIDVSRLHMLMSGREFFSTVRRDTELAAGLIAALVLVVFFGLAIATTVAELIRLATTAVAVTLG
jgi:hypothetical protein